MTEISILEFCERYKDVRYVFVFSSENQKCLEGFNFSVSYGNVIGSTVPNYLTFYNDDGCLCFRNVKNIDIDDADKPWAECRITYEIDAKINECIIIIKKL